jgi:hypothetical protein
MGEYADRLTRARRMPEFRGPAIFHGLIYQTALALWLSWVGLICSTQLPILPWLTIYSVNG